MFYSDKFPIASEGFPFIAIGAALSTLLYILQLTTCFTIVLILTAFTIYFFRDPRRVPPEGDNLVISPADGKVVGIKPVTTGGKDYTTISIFLSVFNVHINRAPITGKIISKNYNPGKFLAAFNEKASLDNEQTALGISGNAVTVTVKQIAGLIARRIVCRPEVGDNILRGQRFGLIKFGSRVDVILPANCTVTVKPGDKVKGGISVLGEIAS